ncbi:hypothetical protein HLVA_02830 [Haliovirga abyssi]|uniref:Membrane transporter protein n=1 Tax=Haliovirga abyssi TaxID=2996794 RepID=A0AAU9D166_9FUSO|nr:hypothetical protein HLVA_02830 [Haliovirga abyssi]
MEFLVLILIVGFVTAGLSIRFDRFFTILLLLFVFKLTIFNAINLFLWVILFGALMIILDNADKISKLPKAMKMKLFTFIPIMTFIFSWLGSYVFMLSSKTVLIVTLGIIAILYGLRLVFIHFAPDELDLTNASPTIVKLCGIFGPIISGFFIGFIGTSLKPLKIPFAIKFGKMNAKQVYLGNTITTFFAAFFTIIWHFVMSKGAITGAIFYQQMILGAALWTGIHYTFELTNIFFKNSWRKPFQIIIGLTLLLVSIKVFMMI